MANVLVVANETIGGRKLLEAVRARAAKGDAQFFLCVPQNRPQHGAVIYDEAVRDAAQVRVDLAEQFMSNEGIEISGDVGDPDPYTAAMDAIAETHAHEVIVSTLPQTASGWLRHDLIERIEGASGVPVEHVVSDLDAEGLPFTVTLVVANQTSESDSLVDDLKKRADDDRHLFIFTIPLADGSGEATGTARAHLNHTLATMRDAGLLCAGMVGDPDPYTATMNALQSFRVDEVVISTFPEGRSRWLRGGLIERLKDATATPIDHVSEQTTAQSSS